MIKNKKGAGPKCNVCWLMYLFVISYGKMYGGLSNKQSALIIVFFSLLDIIYSKPKEVVLRI